jgi:ABC-type lipoprotein release transport system permease subunit
MSLDALVDDPARYGQAWEVVARNRWGDQAPAAIDAVAADPAVDAAATMASGAVVLDGWLTASGTAYNVIVGPDLMTITNGRAVARSNEAVIGASTLRALGAELGDTVDMVPGASNGTFGTTGGTPQTVTLVGEALFPAMVVPGAAVPRLDQGIAVSREVWNELQGVNDEPELTLLSTRTMRDAVLLAERIGDIDEASDQTIQTEWFVAPRPVEIESAADARRWMVSSLVVLTIVVAALLGLALRLVLRAQQRDLAVLRALGTTRRQLRAIVWKQGAMLFLPMAAVGVPIGIAFGRLLYSRLAEKIGVVSDPYTPWWSVAAFVASVAAISAAAVIMSARAVNRVAPALSLREP